MPVLNRIMQFITSKYLKFGDGEVWFGKEEVVIYFLSQAVRDLYYNLGQFGLDYGASMFLSAKTEGNNFVKNNIIPIKKILTPVVTLSCELISSFGYGPIKTIKVDDKEGFMVLLGKSTIANEYKKRHGPSAIPVDFLLGGLFSGALELFTNEKTYCVETRCSAQKDVEECVWVIGNREKILNYARQFSPESIESAIETIDLINKNEARLNV